MALRCRLCASLDVITDFVKGEMVCRSCGCVLVDRLLDDSDQIYLTQRVERTRGKTAEVKDAEKRAAKLHRRDRNLQLFQSKLMDLAEKLQCPPRVTKHALVYMDVGERKGLLTRKTDTLALALLYGANRSAAAPLSMRDFARRAGVTMRAIDQRYKELKRGRDSRGGVFPKEALVRVVSASTLVPRIAAELGMGPGETEQAAQAAADAVEVLQAGGEPRRQPSAVAVAAAVVFMVVTVIQRQMGQREVKREESKTIREAVAKGSPVGAIEESKQPHGRGVKDEHDEELEEATDAAYLAQLERRISGKQERPELPWISWATDRTLRRCAEVADAPVATLKRVYEQLYLHRHVLMNRDRLRNLARAFGRSVGSVPCDCLPVL